MGACFDKFCSLLRLFKASITRHEVAPECSCWTSVQITGHEIRHQLRTGRPDLPDILVCFSGFLKWAFLIHGLMECFLLERFKAGDRTELSSRPVSWHPAASACLECRASTLPVSIDSSVTPRMLVFYWCNCRGKLASFGFRVIRSTPFRSADGKVLIYERWLFSAGVPHPK